MTNLAVTNLTKTRQSLLSQMAEDFNLGLVLLLLLDNDDGQVNLLPSYLYSNEPEIRPMVEDKVHPIDSSRSKDVSDERIIEEARNFMADVIVHEAFDDSAFSYSLLKTDWPPFEFEPRTEGERDIGVLVTAGTKGQKRPGSSQLDQMATSISIGRYQRFVNTVLRTQRSLSEQDGDLDETIFGATKLLAKELGAKRFFYRNKNRNPDWLEWPPGPELASTAEHPHDPVPLAAEVKVPESPMAIRSDGGKALMVVLSQQSFEIGNLAFSNMDEVAGLLKEVRSQAIEIWFHDKAVKGYLQKRFSETDSRIAEVAYKNLQNFAELKLSDQSYSKVFSILHEKALVPDGSAQVLLDILRQLSALIDNVHIITVELLENEIETGCETADLGRPIDAGYIGRLQSKYLKKFYHGRHAPDYGNMAVGMDAADGHFYLEIHTPQEFGNSKIYVVSFVQNVIAQATFHSIANLFSELFTRMKSDEFRQARSSHMTETRHAVVHHFAAALHGIDDIKAKWDKGLRNREYWVSLLNDPVFPDSLDLANWSLNQAQLILENGRFLIKDIDPKSISRKSFNILQVVTDCQAVLRIEARRKSLKMFQRVRGEQPVVANGDEVLMRIAIMNLIDNAIKYSLNNATVRWELIYRPKRYVFSISNVGDPIAEERFNLLMQIGSRGKQRDHLNLRPGTGLGLPVAHRILKAHSPDSGLQFNSETHSRELGGATNTFFFEMPYLTGLSNVSAE